MIYLLIEPLISSFKEPPENLLFKASDSITRLGFTATEPDRKLQLYY